MSDVKADVLIIGAGAAGLACAHRLHQEGLKVIILEARDRIGGRAFTQSLNDFPIELGAEFIHGAAPVTLEILKNNGQHFYDVLDEHHWLKDKKLTKHKNFWSDLEGIIDKLPSKKDQSVEEFLSRLRISRDKKSLFKAYVEGFHAADLGLLGVRGLKEAEEVSEESDLNESELFRLNKGYSKCFSQYLSSAAGLDRALRLQTVVKKIDLRFSTVRICAVSNFSSKPIEFSARQVVLTLPVGVLKAAAESPGGIEWLPELPGPIQQLHRDFEMGAVQKLNFEFRDRFWEDLTADPISFLHCFEENYFPTWWTLQPYRTPILVAWQGGPKAHEMSTWSLAQKTRTALKTLSRLLQKSESFLEKQFVSCRTHDWGADPYSLGAYSYGKVGKQISPLPLHWKKKLFFAGEAWAAGGGRGTVHGALQSGLAAANLCQKYVEAF